MVGASLGRIAAKCLQAEACFGGLAACTLPTWAGPEALCVVVAGILHGRKHKASDIFSSGVSSLVLQMHHFERIWEDPEKSQKQILAFLVFRHRAGSLPQLQASCPKPERLPRLGVPAPESLLRYSGERWNDQLPASQHPSSSGIPFAESSQEGLRVSHRPSTLAPLLCSAGGKNNQC